MNYGIEVYIDHDRVRLTEGLLKPLSAPFGAPIYGLYYPPPTKGDLFEGRDYSQAKIKHDLVLTTIPFDLWPACAAGRLDIHHKRGALEKMLEVFKASGLNILHLQCTRAGHRYATVNFVASLLGIDKAHRLPAGLICQAVRERREKIQELYTGMQIDEPDMGTFTKYSIAFKSECDQLQLDFTRLLGSRRVVEELLRRRGEQQPLAEADPGGDHGILHFDDAFSRFPVGVWSLKELAYFSVRSRHSKTKSTVVRFRATVAEDWSIHLDDPEYLHEFTGLRSGHDLPTVGFANLDTDSYLIRVAILAPEQLKAFRAVSIDFHFKASDERMFSIGVFHDLVKSICPKWNLWRAHNNGFRYEPEIDKRHGFTRGRISFIMEHDLADVNDSSAHLPSNHDIEASLKSLSDSELSIIDAQVRPFTSRKIFISIKSEDKLDRAPEILDICREVGSEFGFLPSNVRTIDENATNSVTRVVSQALRESSGLIEFLMSDVDDESFTWVESELFHATERNIPTVRIVDPRFKEALRISLDKPPVILPQYASRKRFKKAIRRAFGEIVAKITDTGFPSNPRIAS